MGVRASSIAQASRARSVGGLQPAQLGRHLRATGVHATRVPGPQGPGTPMHPTPHLRPTTSWHMAPSLTLKQWVANLQEHGLETFDTRINSRTTPLSPRSSARPLRAHSAGGPQAAQLGGRLRATRVPGPGTPTHPTNPHPTLGPTTSWHTALLAPAPPPRSPPKIRKPSLHHARPHVQPPQPNGPTRVLGPRGRVPLSRVPRYPSVEGNAPDRAVGRAT